MVAILAVAAVVIQKHGSNTAEQLCTGATCDENVCDKGVIVSISSPEEALRCPGAKILVIKPLVKEVDVVSGTRYVKVPVNITYIPTSYAFRDFYKLP
ncbi:hypothetical protein [Hyperthermus butylicus]|uniref:hypothetical protein n=1 Tax=Hyperthermus butylicus TaxID=54248 RepID=UPI00129B68D6|nr:hypothetical protein [Hyperthermus butylicus]